LKNECEISINIRVIIKIASIVEIALGCPSHFIFRRLLRTVSLTVPSTIYLLTRLLALPHHIYIYIYFRCLPLFFVKSSVLYTIYLGACTSITLHTSHIPTELTLSSKNTKKTQNQIQNRLALSPHIIIQYSISAS
jgi:hypothetical protein